MWPGEGQNDTLWCTKVYVDIPVGLFSEALPLFYSSLKAEPEFNRKLFFWADHELNNKKKCDKKHGSIIVELAVLLMSEKLNYTNITTLI